MSIPTESVDSTPESSDGDDIRASLADPKPPYGPSRFFELARQNLRLHELPKAPEIDKDALDALGLLEFVHLPFPSPIASHRDLLAEFISFFSYDYGHSFFHGKKCFVDKDMFGNALKLPLKPSRLLSVTPREMNLAAKNFMDVYILPAYNKRTRKCTIGILDRVGLAMNDVKGNMAYKVEWLELIWEEALKEMFYMIHRRNETTRWDCFYSAYWLRVIWAINPKLFSANVVLESCVHEAATNVPLEKRRNVVIGPETHKPRGSCGQTRTSPQACMVKEVRRTEHMDNEQIGDEAENGDASVGSNLLHISGGLLRSAANPDGGTAREGTDLFLAAIETMNNPASKCDDTETKRPEKNIGSKMHMIIYNEMQASSAKRQIVVGSCGEIITKKHRLITCNKVTNPWKSGPSSLERMEAQKNLNKDALATSPEDEEAIGLMAHTICSEDWDATKSIKCISEIKQNVKEIVQQYVESAASIFDSSTILPVPKKLDQTPGSPLQPPEPDSSGRKFVFQKIITGLKNLTSLANAEQFNQEAFYYEVTLTLDGWDFFSPLFTEEIKQMVTKLKALKKEVDDERSQRQSVIKDLIERIKQIDEIQEKAKFVREQITKSKMEIEQLKHAGNGSQESLSALETGHTSYIQEQERKVAEANRNVAERKEKLRLVQLLAKNADFFAQEIAANKAIAFSSTSFEKVATKVKVLREEMVKRRQQVEDGGLEGPLQALRSLITCYPIKE